MQLKSMVRWVVGHQWEKTKMEMQLKITTSTINRQLGILGIYYISQGEISYHPDPNIWGNSQVFNVPFKWQLDQVNHMSGEILLESRCCNRKAMSPHSHPMMLLHQWNLKHVHCVRMCKTGRNNWRKQFHNLADPESGHIGDNQDSELHMETY